MGIESREPRGFEVYLQEVENLAQTLQSSTASDTEKEITRPSDFRQIEDQLNNHGLETLDTIRLRDEIKKFFELHKQEIEQAVGTDRFSVMVGGSLQAGTADSYSDIDLTIIINFGNTGKIWTHGGFGETTEGVRGILLFRQDSLKQQTQRDIDINLLSAEDIIEQLESFEFLESKNDIFFVIDDVIRIFSPQLYGKKDVIEDFRRSVIQQLSIMSNGEQIWNEKIVPQLRGQLMHRIGDKKGDNWPERENRSQDESQQKDALSGKIAEKLGAIQIPNFQEMKTAYGI